MTGAEPGLPVTGQVLAAQPGGLGNLHVEIVERGIGSDRVLSTAVTGADGRFRTNLTDVPDRPDLQVRVWSGEAGGAALLGESPVRFGATGPVVLDVPLARPPVPAGPEFDVLTASLHAGFDGRLADLEESGTRRDVTFLADKTGWDPAVVARTVVAEQLSDDAGGRIPPPLYYALVRAGLPADPDTLYRARPDAVARVWRDAVDHGVVAPVDGPELDRALSEFGELAASRALGSRAVPGTSTLGELVDRTFGGDPDSAAGFARLYTAHGADPGAFWTGVEERFGADTAQRLRVDGRLATLTLNNAPLVAAVQDAEEPANGALGGVADLARRGWFRPDRWREVLDAAPVPDGIAGDSDDQRRDRYAEVLAASVRLASPTAVVAARVADGELLAGSDPEVRDGVAEFLTAHLGRFELGIEPVERFVGAHDDVAGPAPAAVGEIKRIQRVYQLTPHDDAMSVLLDRGLDSALVIADQDEADFVAARTGDLGAGTARDVHARARQVSNAVLNVATGFLASRVSPDLGMRADAPILTVSRRDEAGYPSMAEIMAAAGGAGLVLPTLDTLFDLMDADACDHCGSVLSPAAYLVDLLLFLNRPSAPVNPQTALLARRPDIENLPLTCENTNTEVPYIDLVTETLEYFVAHDLSLDGFTGHDTGPDADPAELLADPQFVDDTVYATLAAEQYPPPLPYDDALESVRLVFARLGTPLADAMRTLRRGDDVERPPEVPGDGAAHGWRDVLAEELGLSRAAHRALTDRTITVPRLLGYPDGTPDATVTAEMTGVRALAGRLGVDYTDLVAVLGARSVGGDGPAPLLLVAPDGGGDTTSFADLLVRRADGGGPAPADLLRMARLVRLRRTLGWSVPQCDAALVALHPETLHPAAGPVAGDEQAALDTAWSAVLPRLGVVLAAARRLGLVVERDLPALLACWSPVDTSLYRRLSGSDPVFTRTGIGPLGPDDDPRLVAHADALCAALGLTAAELDAIVRDLPGGAGTPLSAEAVDAVHRRAWLSAAAGTGRAEFLALVRATGLDPFGPPDPPRPGVLDLLDLLDGLRAAGLSVADALRLVWNVDGAGGPAVPDTAADDDLARALRALPAAAGAADVLAAVATSTRTDPAVAEALLTDPAVLHAPGDPATPALAALAAVGPAGALDAEPGGTVYRGYLDVPAADRYLLTITVAAPEVAVGLEVDGAPVELEIDGGTRRGRVAGTPGRARLVPVTVTVGGPAEPPVLSWQFGSAAVEAVPAARVHGRRAVDDLRAVAARFRCATGLAGALALPAAETVHLARDPDLRAADGTGWLNAVPVPGTGTAAGPLRGALDAALTLARIRSVLHPDGDALVRTLRTPAAQAPDGRPAPEALTGWDTATIDTLLGRFGLTRADLAHLTVWRRLLDAHALVTAFAVPTASLVRATTNAPDAVAVRTVHAALRSRGATAGAGGAGAGTDGMVDVVRSVTDPLRRRRRDALVAHVLHGLSTDPARSHVDTADKLYEHLLTDVAMEPCMRTSRVRHAISAVQLFVERVLMNLEPDVPPSSLNAAHWEWMKRYRLWEANRQVFLWPENWLEPGLRDNQSPIFRRTMGELLQGDITDDVAATALLGYLSGLEEVAKLEPCSIHYVEGEPGRGDDIAHVVARSPGAERRYYHRRREFGTWSPWEQIGLDIEDNPVTPVYWRGRLLLFWLRIVQTSVPPASPPPDGTPLAGASVDQVRAAANVPVRVRPEAVLVWSEFYNGRWQAPKTSKIGAPTSFGGQTFDTAGENAFRRDALVLGETLEGDALRVRISGQGDPTSFLMLNTHSLPQRQEERFAPAVDDSARLLRDVTLDGQTLTLTFRTQTTVAARPVLRRRQSGPARVVAPFPVSYVDGGAQQGLIRNPWEAPFLYEDGRHVFHVTIRPPGPPGDGAPFGVIPPAPEPIDPFLIDPSFLERNPDLD